MVANTFDGLPVTVITICGSTRFRTEIAAANRDLTLAGFVVLAPGVFAHDGDTITAADKIALDALHLTKIRMSEAVFVVNPGGYIGESTRQEIAYARWLDKPVRYLVTPADQLDVESSPAAGTCSCGGQLDPVVDGCRRYCPDCRSWWEIHPRLLVHVRQNHGNRATGGPL